MGIRRSSPAASSTRSTLDGSEPPKRAITTRLSPRSRSTSPGVSVSPAGSLGRGAPGGGRDRRLRRTNASRANARRFAAPAVRTRDRGMASVQSCVRLWRIVSSARRRCKKPGPASGGACCSTAVKRRPSRSGCRASISRARACQSAGARLCRRASQSPDASPARATIGRIEVVATPMDRSRNVRVTATRAVASQHRARPERSRSARWRWARGPNRV